MTIVARLADTASMKDLGKSDPPARLPCSTPRKPVKPVRRCANCEIFGESVRRGARLQAAGMVASFARLRSRNAQV